MDTRKVTLVATIAVIALVAVGIGYAYSASTLNSGNNATVEYVTLVQGGDGAYTFTTTNHNEIEWNTADAKNDNSSGDSDYAKTTFTLASPIAQTPATGYTLQQVGQDFTIVTTSTNTTGLVDQTCSIAATGFNTDFGNGTAAIFLKVVCNETPTLFKYDSGAFKVWTVNAGVESLGASTFTIPDNNGTAFYPATVSVFYGYATADNGIAVTHAKGTAPVGPTGANTKPLVNATLTFSIDTVATS